MICFYSCFYPAVKLNSEIQKLKVRRPWARVKAKICLASGLDRYIALNRFKKLGLSVHACEVGFRRHCEPTGPREARPDDRLREAIYASAGEEWIASSLRFSQ
jgi:hypothetical protein